MSVNDADVDDGESDDLDRRKVLGMVGGLMAATAGVGEVAAGSAEPSYEVYGVFSDEDAPPDSLEPASSKVEVDGGTLERLDGAVYQTNGCGAADGVDVPDGNWGGCCDAHDLCYAEGGTREDRERCDDLLYSCMSTVTNDGIAYTYYRAVRWWGDDAFNWDCPSGRECAGDPISSR